MKQRVSLKGSLFLAASCAALSMTAANAQSDGADGADDDVDTAQDVVVVRGVRRAQEAAIGIKRSNSEILDAIVAEDIGKLPDFTISDALQRVTGVQISRVAGEGAGVSIRGSQDVLATLNGERFITAETLLESSADFQDIPASLVTGINVYKSQNASQTDGGVGGIVDLRTLRSLTLDEGYTFSGSVQGGTGDESQELNYRIEGLIGAKWGDRIAMSLTGSFSDTTNASARQFVENPNQRAEGGLVDLNGNGSTTDTFIVPLVWAFTTNSREFDRQRLGLAYNFNAELGGGWEMVADVVYNDMNETENGQTLFFDGGFTSAGDITSISRFEDASSQSSQDYFATGFTALRDGFRAGVNAITRDTEALNTNLEFNYDNGGAFTGSIRGVYSDASRDRGSINLAQQTNSRIIPRSAADLASNTLTELNPGAINDGRIYPFTVGVDGGELEVSIDPALAAIAAQPESFFLHSNWLESEFTDATQLILRADGSYDTGNGLSFDFGLRFSDRDTDQRRADYFSPSGIPGLLNKFAEGGYAIGQTTGTAAPFDYDPIPVFQIESPEISDLVTTVTDFGDIPGLELALPLIDTDAISGDFTGFRDRLYGPGQFITLPDRSYTIQERQFTGYFLTDFNTPLSSNVNLSGNVGLRVVRTTIDVTRNLVQDGLLRQDILAGLDPNHSAFVDLGDIVTSTTRTTALPSVNLNFDVGDTHRFKISYIETQALQPFNNLARGDITLFFGEMSLPGGGFEPFQRVSTIERLGNPELEPTRQRSISGAWEWYPQDSTLISLGGFYNEVDSYTFTRETQVDAPDSDGVVRNGAVLREITNGFGGNYWGFEAAYQQSFTNLPGLLANTGVTLNYTFSPSQSGIDGETGEEQILADGSVAPLNETAKHQANAILFYEDDRFQFRAAANYLSDQFLGANGAGEFFPIQGVGAGEFLDSTLYVDLNASFDISEQIQIYANARNVTNESERSYRGFENFGFEWNQFERQFNVGVRARF